MVNTSTAFQKLDKLIESMEISNREFGELLNPKATRGVVRNWRKGRNAPRKTAWRLQIEKLSNGTIAPIDWD